MGERIRQHPAASPRACLDDLAPIVHQRVTILDASTSPVVTTRPQSTLDKSKDRRAAIREWANESANIALRVRAGSYCRQPGENTSKSARKSFISNQKSCRNEAFCVTKQTLYRLNKGSSQNRLLQKAPTRCPPASRPSPRGHPAEMVGIAIRENRKQCLPVPNHVALPGPLPRPRRSLLCHLWPNPLRRRHPLLPSPLVSSK